MTTQNAVLEMTARSCLLKRLRIGFPLRYNDFQLRPGIGKLLPSNDAVSRGKAHTRRRRLLLRCEGVEEVQRVY
jgi:hypothetical protein